jgi:hypothetical protein
VTGFSGSSDSFTYQVDTSEQTSALASATIYFGSGARVWYVDNSDSGGDGSSAAPFNSLATAVGAAQPGDVIFLFGNATTPYGGGETLGTGETLVGQPGTASRSRSPTRRASSAFRTLRAAVSRVSSRCSRPTTRLNPGGGALALATPNGAVFNSCTVTQPNI